jgi:uncharacterized integral membrane protein
VKLLWWIILLPLLALAAAFAVANRTGITVSLDPLPFVFDTPIYVALMAAIFVGLIVGGISTWMAARPWRREARRSRRNIKLLEAEVDSLRARLAEPVNSPASSPANSDVQTTGETSLQPPANV